MHKWPDFFFYFTIYSEMTIAVIQCYTNKTEFDLMKLNG